GMMAVNSGLPVWAAVAISMTNLTSAGQFAGLSVMVSMGSYIEMILTQFIINLRYALMSISLSQKIDKSVTIIDRLFMATGNTDEIFAVSSSQPSKFGKKYFFGLMTLPYFGWAGGTLVGALASTFLPESVSSALGIAIYAMFLAIIIPPSKKSKTVLLVVLISAGLSCLFKYAPYLNKISSGFVIIICAVVAATIGALVRPLDTAEREGDER
ncbi:MAG: AzlC family ABC transporter permease, partial [Clostridiales bacterium]|nr:AzlC family ABC transporter permease [Clostridiales bacterium]